MLEWGQPRVDARPRLRQGQGLNEALLGALSVQKDLGSQALGSLVYHDLER